MRSKSPDLMDKILKFVEEYYLDNGHSPSTSAISKALKISRTTAYLIAFPMLTIMLYAGMKQMSIKTNYDKAIGIPLEMYIAEENVAIETRSDSEKIENLKEHLCKARNIKLLKVPYKIGNDEATYAIQVKKALRSVHVFINSDEAEDIAFIRQRFFEWKARRSL